MERPAGWKVLTLGVALAGIGVAGAGGDSTAAGGTSLSKAPASVSPATLFDQPELLASGGGHGHGHGNGPWGHWDQGNYWGSGWYPNVGGCVSATGPYGNVSAGVCF